MQRKSQTQLPACPEFVLHIVTGRVGFVTGVSTAGMDTRKTIRLAEGEILAAPAHEFRPATDAEIEKRHRVAASIRPLAMPDQLTSRSSPHTNPPSHRFGL